jgi:benzoate/toluate 1,2-dioxygenase reductase component
MEALSLHPSSCSQAAFTTRIVERRWLSSKAFALTLFKPPQFTFLPGQRICLALGGAERDYSLVSAPGASDLSLCIRHVAEGLISPQLARCPEGQALTFSGPHGYFTFKPSRRPAVFVATGTGIAPFCSISASGVSGFVLLHGVETAADLYYQDLLQASARRYVPCLSGVPPSQQGCFAGRVTDYIERHLPPGEYDFYLCGRQEMTRDVTFIADERFPGSRVYTEIFF